MTKVTLKIEIVVDEEDAEDVCADVRELYWGHRVGMFSYKSTIERMPISFCKACGDPIFKETSNSLCKDSVCTRIRQIEFNENKDIDLNAWKRMMCDKCTEKDDTLYCYLNDNLIHNSSTCKGCLFELESKE